MTFTYQQHINGAWTGAASGGTWKVINPATEEVVRSVPFGGREDCHTAIEAAARAFPEWSRRTPYERGAILQRAAARMREVADEAAHAMVLECGKPLAQARGEWMVAADLFDWFAEEGKRAYGRTIPSRIATKRMTVLRQPLGVVGVITAWNFPAYNPARAWAAALAAGCTVVGRPSEFTPLTAMAMTEVLVEAGIPSGVLNLINGDPEAMGQEMLDHPACRKISFTGSVRVGKLLMDGASRTVTRLSLELGGNAPVIVLPDVDLEQVAGGAITSKFRNNGQVCASSCIGGWPTRLPKAWRTGPPACASAADWIRPCRWARSSMPASAIAWLRWWQARPARVLRSVPVAASPPRYRWDTSSSRRCSLVSRPTCRCFARRSSDR